MVWRTLLALVALALTGAFLYGVIGPPPTAPGSRIVLPGTAMGSDQDDSYRILILGTSLTSRGDWPELLQEQLSACAAGSVLVERLARAGSASGWGLSALRNRLSASDANIPDLLIVEFSGNDASLARGYPLFVSKRNHRKIIQLARNAGVAVILTTMSPAWGQNAFERPGQERYHALYRDLAASGDVGLIDTIPEWRALSSRERRAAVPDGVHPTPDSMAKIAVPAFLDAVRPLAGCRNSSP